VSTACQPSPLSAEASARLDNLFRLYNSRVVAFAGRFARRPADADDIAAEAWIIACRYIEGLKADDDHARPWLFTLVRMAARKHYRAKRNDETPADFTETAFSLPASPPADVETDIEVLDCLTPVQARMVKLAAQGMSQRSIAVRLGRHKGTVSRQMMRAQLRLRSYALAG
jgi:RNA polymerase sigma factor (sigma-70 family)